MACTIRFPTSRAKFCPGPIRRKLFNLLPSPVLVHCTHSDSLCDLKKHLQACTQARENREEDAEMIWLGDFNRHHPQWNDEQNTHLFTRSNLDEAQILINATINYNLQMMLSKKLPTLITMSTGNYTRTDNVFISSTFIERLTTCTNSSTRTTGQKQPLPY